MSLYEKQKRIRSKQAFEYHKPEMPLNYQRNLDFKFQKGMDVLAKNGMKQKQKGEALFQTITRD